MKRALLLIALVSIVALAAAGCTAADSPKYAAQQQTPTSAPSNTSDTSHASNNATGAHSATTNGDTQASSHAGHGHDAIVTDKNDVPAFEVSEASLKNLEPTLAPEMFTGKARMAYQATREIPQTIAQLPCYCHCDKGFGHKSLHSCYVDDHAAHCAVCVDEVLMAYRLQKEEKLKPEQIRERIIAEYSSQGF